MPVRFQVDPDFYDHPKSIGLSDAATALWVRAGSYSAAKLLDGFIAENVLSTLSHTPEEAADELIARGLWRRTKGGYQFHQYKDRNLTRADVEHKREGERKRKRRQRKPSPQVTPRIVPPGLTLESHRDSDTGPTVTPQNVPGDDPDTTQTQHNTGVVSDVVSTDRPRKRGVQLPSDWKPCDKHRELAGELGVNLDAEVQQFRDHHTAKGSTFKDWDAALRTWLRNAAKFGGGRAIPFPNGQQQRPVGVNATGDEWMRRRPGDEWKPAE